MARNQCNDPTILGIRDLARDKRANRVLGREAILDILKEEETIGMQRAREAARNLLKDRQEGESPLARALRARKVALQAANGALAAEAARKRVAARNSRDEAPAIGSDAASALADAQAIMAGTLA